MDYQRAARSPHDGVEPPVIPDTAQFGHATFLEDEPGTGDEIAHRLRDEHFSGCRLGRHARADVNTDSPDLPIHELALTSVQSGANLDPEVADGVGDHTAATNCARRPVEGREKPIARGVEFAPPEASELAPDRDVVLVEELSPAAFAEFGVARSASGCTARR
jgi:hypothetical protein